MCEPGRKSSEGCRCRSSLLRGFIRPQLLLRFANQPAHGYELMETLGQTGDLSSSDPGNFYRALRRLEEEGLVRSNWDTSDVEPARRVYDITEEGVEYLDAWIVNLRETRRKLDDFLADYENQFSAKRNSKHLPEV